MMKEDHASHKANNNYVSRVGVGAPGRVFSLSLFETEDVRHKGRVAC